MHDCCVHKLGACGIVRWLLLLLDIWLWLYCWTIVVVVVVAGWPCWSVSHCWVETKWNKEQNSIYLCFICKINGFWICSIFVVGLNMNYGFRIMTRWTIFIMILWGNCSKVTHIIFLKYFLQSVLIFSSFHSIQCC